MSHRIFCQLCLYEYIQYFNWSTLIIADEKHYYYPIEIAVEPPPEKRPQYSIALSLTCSSAMSYNTIIFLNFADYDYIFYFNWSTLILADKKPYHYRIEIGVEPPPEKRPQNSITLSLNCSSALSYNTACSGNYFSKLYGLHV